MGRVCEVCGATELARDEAGSCPSELGRCNFQELPPITCALCDAVLTRLGGGEYRAEICRKLPGDDCPFPAPEGVAAPDPVDHPPHYNGHPSGVECIDVAEHMNFNRGNALKYLWRAGLKGDELEDLKKARWYLDREIARVETGLKGKPE